MTRIGDGVGAVVGVVARMATDVDGEPQGSFNEVRFGPEGVVDGRLEEMISRSPRQS